MRVVTSGQMRGVEYAAVHTWGIPSLLLMENAAVRTVPHILRLLGEGASNRVAVVCGPGNNGGDGYAVARHLYAAGAEVAVVFAGGIPGEGSDARVNRDIACRLGIPFYEFSGETEDGEAETEVAALIKASGVTVDALFGTGLSRPPEGVFAEVIHLINTRAKTVLSLDIPSGVNADTGQVMGCAVRARETVAYGYLKLGLLLYPGAAHGGCVRVEDITLPPAIKAEGRAYETLTEAEIPERLPARPPFSHKGRFGRVRVLAGCRNMPGAAALGCLAAYRAGAGLVDACVVKEVARVIHARVPEAVTTRVPGLNGCYAPDSAAEFADLPAAQVLLLGPGIGRGAPVTDFVFKVLENSRCPVVLDADGLYAVAEDVSVLKKIPCAVTPHPGEMSRLMRVPVQEITEDPVGAATAFADAYGTVVLLKGARSVIAAPEGLVTVNTTGNAALAKAGTGDVLAGMIAGLAAQGLDLSDACALGAYLHGKAGARAGEALSLYGVNAGDVIEALPGVLRAYDQNV